MSFFLFDINISKISVINTRNCQGCGACSILEFSSYKIWVKGKTPVATYNIRLKPERLVLVVKELSGSPEDHPAMSNTCKSTDIY